MPTHYLACDLGAESGRLMLGTLDSDSIQLEEVHRFPNTPIEQDGSLCWDMARLWTELKTGLRKAGARRLPISSISTDSWGVDYLLFAANGELISPTFHYRDHRTEQGVKNAFEKIDWKTIFAETGIQFMPLNTIFQLAAESPDRLKKAEKLLGVGDAFNYLLSGVSWAEESLASTFQLYNPRIKAWSELVLNALNLRREIFPPVIPSGTRLGPLRAELSAECNLSPIDVIATCSHDTGAAVAAVPATGEDWAYLSSGTWSLMGVELGWPIITDACRELNFTNEIGYRGSIRLLKNIIGLWLVQESRREWGRLGKEYDYATLTAMASSSPPFVSLINPADPRFLSPGDMPGKIADYCRETGQPMPSTPGATIRCALESLALLYRRTLGQIEQLVGSKIRRLHVVGGGSKNQLLNQFTANSVQIPVLAGPVEATALGNILVQALTMGHLRSWEHAREVVGKSHALSNFVPQETAAWDKAYERFGGLR